LRRMRTEYGARLEALVDAATRHCRGALTLRPVATGLHAVADLEDADDRVVFDEARERGVEAMPLSAYSFDGRMPRPHALVLGFAAVRPELMDAAMQRLGAAIEAARRSTRRRTTEASARRNPSKVVLPR
jgi:DNA-binding transcriptional MocR family regulator